MFQKGLHYKNRRFGFKVLQIKGNKMLVLLENDGKAVLNLELQTRIQQIFLLKLLNPTPHLNYQNEENIIPLRGNNLFLSGK